MNIRLTLVAAGMLCSIWGCGSQESTAGGAAAQTDGGVTGSASTGTRPPPTGPSGDEICGSDTSDALLTLNLWSPSMIRGKLQKKPATEPPGSPCEAMQESCCKPQLEVMMVKELVRPYYKQRCANATKDSVGAACWRIGRNTRQALYNNIAGGFKLLVTQVNDEINNTLNTTLPPDTFDDFLKYMTQFVHNTNICQLDNVTTAAMHRLFDAVYQLQGGGNWRNKSAEFQACYQYQASSYLQMYNTNAFSALENILNDLRLFSHALTLVEQVLHTVAGHQYPEECLRALPELQYCAYCGGYSNPKPCLNFCLNTMRGCFANVAALKDDFTRLTTLLSSYADNVIAVQWQPTSLVDAHLSTFITAAQNMMKTNLTLMVSIACDNSLTSNRSSLTTNLNATGDHRMTRAVVDMNTVTSVTGTGMAAAMLSNAISNDFQCISSVEGLLDTMPKLLCSEGKNPLSSGANDYCWNGSNVGSYVMVPVGVSRDDQVNNPVFQLNLSVPYQYQSLSGSIKSISDKLRIVLDCLVSDDEDCDSITNFYTCVEVTRDSQGSGSGQGPGNGFEDIEDVDVQSPTSAASNLSAPSSQPSAVGKGGTAGSTPTTNRGSVTTRVYDTSIGDMNITVDTVDTTVGTTNTTTGITTSPNSGALSITSVAWLVFLLSLWKLC